MRGKVRSSGSASARNPDGEPVPADGRLPAGAVGGLARQPFGIYVHVPFCVTRCGYCDFNTYTAADLGGGATRAAYPELAAAEVRMARRVLGTADLPVSSVFFGGGTPALLPPAGLGRILAAIAAEFGLAADAEVTAEANPESVDERSLAQLRGQGINRISFGMQSAVPRVLETLDRVHSPGRSAACVAWARSAGFEHVNLDLIYGTPGETDADWRHSVEAALAAGPDHISAYALTVERGTRLAARIARGEIGAPDDDAMADRYLTADECFSAHGLTWYEISNWAAGDAAACRHNLLYWTGGNWWGIGPGAHSHVGGVRWWNVKHPAAYAARIARNTSPGQARELLTSEQQRLERVLLRTRLATGCPVSLLGSAGSASSASSASSAGIAAAEQAVADGLADAAAYRDGRVVLTPRGRLLADTVVRGLTG
jgi:putative oxygen-independent coproporphyrinogen III oxidase